MLTEGEAARLGVLEDVIERGVRSFADMGRALREIRDSRLYRLTHSTFEDYCREKWHFNDRRASQLIAAAEVSTIVGTGGPATESQARELAPLREDPAGLQEAWARANEIAAGEDRRVTAEDVREAREARSPEAPRLAVAPVPPPTTESGDLRFAMIEDAVQMLKILPAPEECPFPTSRGDVASLDEAIKWLRQWTPRLDRAWRRHKRALRDRDRAAA